MNRPRLQFIRDLLKPHSKTLMLGLAAAVGEGVANLVEPWPLKLVLDNLLRSQPTKGWLNRWLLEVAGPDKLAIIWVAAIGALIIAIVGALCSYFEKFLTT